MGIAYERRGLQISYGYTSLPLTPSPRSSQIDRKPSDKCHTDGEQDDEKDGREKHDRRFDEDEIRQRGV